MKDLWDNIYHKKKERRGLSILLLIIFTALVSRYVILKYAEPDHQEYTDLVDEVKFVSLSEEKDAFYEKRKAERQKEYDAKRIASQKDVAEKKKNEEFIFDPNTISADSLTLLGLPSFIGKNLVKYRNKGGKIKDSNDFKRIYGVDKHYDKIAHLIKIKKVAEIETPDSDVSSTQSNFSTDSIFNETREDSSKTKRDTISKYPKRKYKREIVELNSADSLGLLSLRGVGPFYSKTIREYRDKLGGFYSIEQLKEAYGTPDTILNTVGKEWVTIDSNLIKKINVNTADFKTLLRHPYISIGQTRSLTAYRKMHGDFKTAEAIQESVLIDDKDYERLRHYLIVK